MEEAAPSTWLMGLYALSSPTDGAPQLIEYLQETASVPSVPAAFPCGNCRPIVGKSLPIPNLYSRSLMIGVTKRW